MSFMSGDYSVRHGTVVARQRQSRFGRLTRHSCFHLHRDNVFSVRKSLVDYVDKELKDMNTSVFYQRIFIFAKHFTSKDMFKNFVCGITPKAADNVEQETEDYEQESESSETSAEGSQSASTNTTLTSKKVSLNEINPKVPQSEGLLTESALAGEVLTNTFRFTDEELNKKTELPKEKEKPAAKVWDESDSRYTIFKEKLIKLHKNCLNVMLTPDPMCGLYLYMGEYAMLMLEGSEDMMGIFCKELLDCKKDFWGTDCVFHVEDHIHQLYTNELMFRKIPAAFINEKFPTSTPTDEHLMGKQHIIIKEKLLNICRLISESILLPSGDLKSSGSNDFTGSIYENDDSISVKSVKSMASYKSETLPVESYRKLLPEIQRIDLVLAAKRFYYTLEEFTGIYGTTPHTADTDGLFWPIQNNYTPPNIFHRTPFDINLIFPDYAEAMQQDKSSAEQLLTRPSQDVENVNTTHKGDEGH